MRTLCSFLLLLCLLFPLTLSGQGKKNYVGEWYQRTSQGRSATHVKAFAPGKSDFGRTKRYVLKANTKLLNSLIQTQPAVINLPVPYGGKTYTLNLAKVDIVSPDFSVVTDKGSARHHTGVQYRGIVDNNPAHIASLSITLTEKAAFFSTSEGNFVIAKEKNDYVVYNQKEMPNPEPLFCETPEVDFQVPFQTDVSRGIGCKTVNVYFECDYALYQAKGSSTTAVTDFVMGFFNQVATLYANEDISIQVSQVFTWTTTDPYASMTTPSAIMNAFKTNRGTSFNGHLAHFITSRNVGGGIAYVNVLCNKAYAYGASRIYTTYSNFPTYSWTVNVIAHELGHNLGSPHTHSCSWTGGALDNCQPPEGSCAAGPPPVNGGTIMSYCQLTSSGINFNNGFGSQPGNLIRNKVLNATCITAGTSTPAPTGLVTTNISSSGATLTWLAVPGASSYTAQYKLASASTWTTAGTTSSLSLNVTGLTGSSNYVWQVKSDCSAFSNQVSFTTTGGTSGCSAPSSMVSSNVTQTAATLSWGAVAGATGYTVQYKTTAATTWTSVNAASTSVSISGLTAGTSYVWQVKASCSAYSAQSSFSTTSSTGCSAPGSLTTSGITSSGATLSWSAVSGSTGYTIQYKTATSSTWTTTTSTTTSRPLTGLTAGTSYVWQVKASCSAYSSQASFSTTSTSGCNAPSSLAATGVTQTGATLSWSAVAGATSYTIQYRKSSVSTWTTTTSTVNSKAITGLTAGTTYVWQVKASCSGYSSQASFVTTSTTTGCAVPTNMGESNISTTSATLTWTGPSNASYYSIRYRLVGSSGWTFRNNVTGNSITLTGLLRQRNYQWMISARCTNGQTSSLSASRTFKTL